MVIPGNCVWVDSNYDIALGYSLGIPLSDSYPVTNKVRLIDYAVPAGEIAEECKELDVVVPLADATVDDVCKSSWVYTYPHRAHRSPEPDYIVESCYFEGDPSLTEITVPVGVDLQIMLACGDDHIYINNGSARYGPYPSAAASGCANWSGTIMTIDNKLSIDIVSNCYGYIRADGTVDVVV